MQLMPAGAMAAIGLAESALRPRLVPGVAIAAVNGPEICLVSGPTSAVQSLERTLVADRYGTSTSRVARVPLADDAADRRAVSACGRRGVASAADPPVPVVPDGNLDQTGRGNLTRLLARHVLEAVRFADAVAVLLGDESFIPIEVGPQLAGATRGATAARPRSPDHRDHASRARSEGRCRRSPRRCRQGVGVRLGDRLSCAGCQTGSPSSCRLIRSNDSVSGLSRGVRVPPAGRGR